MICVGDFIFLQVRAENDLTGIKMEKAEVSIFWDVKHICWFGIKFCSKPYKDAEIATNL